MYRPITAGAPLADKQQNLLAALDAKPLFGFKAPNDYGFPTWYALLDSATDA